MIPNQLFNRPDNASLFGKCQKLMSKKLLLMVACALFCANLSAQTAKAAQPAPVTHLNQFMSTLVSSGNQALANHLESLLKNVQPSAYATDANIEVRGGTPVCLYVDAKTLRNGTFNPAALDKTKIELVTIKINNAQDMNGGIDLSPFASFPKLKYIYILAEYVTTEQSIIASVENNNPQYSVFYNILRTN